MNTVCIGWTTVETREQAETLARELVETQLAACVQIDGPLTSVYSWQGELHTSQEYRLAVKFAQKNAEALLERLHVLHPYEMMQWVSVKADAVSPAYAQWVTGP